MDDVLNRLRSELTGRYEVEQELGRGGMAVVYLAKDLRHERKVAIKVLRQGVTAGSERFLREIRTVAQLHHPHILQLLESGRAGDHLFYVMPYVEGDTLRQRLERTGPLTVDEAVRIAREVADALEFAHARGIVHRDIKPENIFLSAGHALVADFGIARAADAAAGATTTLTDAGLAVGTPAYMSPEQATADPKVDGRSDQYALACVLYEMLAGAPPFTGPTSQAIMARHTVDPVPPLTTVRAVPASLESAIVKALAKMPADRWPSARGFAEQLERAAMSRTSEELTLVSTGRATRQAWLPWGVAGTLLVTSVLLWRWNTSRQSELRAESTEQVRSVALRQFDYRGDSAYEYIAETFADLLTPGLIRVDGLSIKDRSQVAARTGRSDDVAEIGKTLDVDAVLSGDVQVRRNLIYVSARLTRVADGVVLWQANLYGDLEVEGQPRDVFAITDSLAVAIVAALRPELTPERLAAVSRGVRTTNLEALALYQEARRATFESTRLSTGRAVELLHQAIAKDSAFADAWAALADAMAAHDTWRGIAPAEQAVAGQRVSQRAIDLDPQNGFALTQRAWWRALYSWDWDGAWRDMGEAVRLAPSSPDVAANYSFFLNFVNEPDSALAHMRRAIALDRSNSFMWSGLSFRFLFARMPDSAIVASERALALDSTNLTAHTALMHLYVDAGRQADAARSANRLWEFDGEVPNALSLATYYRRIGDRVGANRLLSRLTTLARTQYVAPGSLGAARLALGDRSGALAELERGRRERDLELPGSLMFWFAPLREDLRFEALRRDVFGNRRLAESPVP